MLSYRGFLGSTDYYDDDEVFYGTVVNASTIMSFRGASVDELKSSFRDIVTATSMIAHVRGSSRRSLSRGRSLSVSRLSSTKGSR